MSDLRDTSLQGLFDQPVQIADDNEFVVRTMQKIDQRNRRTLYLWITVGGGLIIIASLFAVPLEIATFLTQSLTMPLFSLGGGWLAWAMTPINNAGALVLLLIRLLRFARPKSSEWHVSLLPF
ncbi:MAG: hypothetical protein ACJA0W_000062 [Candidatus Azotimanducaceae bacterium]|jgi:hypothetical protein